MRDDTRRIAVVVLGSHRSGTSALTRAVSLWGATLPRGLMPPNRGNPAGYWESLEVAALNDRVLEALGSRWDDFGALDWSDAPAGTLEAYQNDLQDLIEAEYGDAPRIVLKDPRLCRLVEPCEAVLSRLGFAVRYLLLHRDPFDVVASLMRRERMTSGLAALIWLRHQLDAEEATREKARVVIPFRGLLEDWRGVARQAARRLEVEWPEMDGEAEVVDGFLARPARGNSDGIVELDAHPTVRDWVEATHAAFEALAVATGSQDSGAAGEIDDAEARAALDAVRSEFDPASSVASAVLAVRQELERRMEELRLQSKSLEARNLPLRDDLVEARQTIEELRGRVEALSRRERELEAQLEDAAARNARLGEDVRSILASNSWRLTRPLRALRGLLRGPRHRGARDGEASE